MVDLSPPDPISAAIDESGGMLQRFMNWTQDVTNAINFSAVAEGAGSPENVISAKANKQYRDTAGPNLYWKSVDDVAGDKKKGWLLVV